MNTILLVALLNWADIVNNRAFISLEWHLTSCGTPIILASDNQKAFVAFPIMSRSGLEWRKQTIFLAEADEQTMSASWFTKGDIFVSTNLRCVVIDRRGAYMEVLSEEN